MIARGKREARRPWLAENKLNRALKVRNINAVIPLFQSLRVFDSLPRGDAPRFARCLPLAIIFRAGGAPVRFKQSFLSNNISYFRRCKWPLLRLIRPENKTQQSKRERTESK